MSYFKKQPKKTRAIYLNTQDAYYINEDRTKFSFKISNGINVEDESLLYVKNTTIDYNTSGLSVKQVNTPVWTPLIGATYGLFYPSPPPITFISQDGKGSGASAVAVLEGNGLSTSASSTATALTIVNGGSGYYGNPSNYISTFTTTSGGQGASVYPTISTSFSGIATGNTAFPTITPAGTTGGAIASTNERWVQFPYGGTGSTQNYTFTTLADLYTDMVVAGGGGAGGNGYGGGGGGGAVIPTQKQFYRAGTFTIRVGKGGVPVASSTINPTNGIGADSSVNYGGVDIYVAKGGGAGGNAGTSGFYSGTAGGSGGGGSGFITDNTNYNIATGGIATTANTPSLKYGNNGGKGNYETGISMCGGGGGGAGEVGQDAFFQPPLSLGKGGNGGQGIPINMIGSIQILGSGGGGGASSTGSSTGAGGTNAGNGASNGVGSNASAGYGGGGGGGGRTTGNIWYAGGSGGTGVVQMRYYASDTATGDGSFTAGTLTAGSGYTDVPTINIPPPPPTVLATFGATPITASTGTITACPDVLNPTLNGFYNAGTFTVGFQNNPVIAQGFCNTNSSGGLTNIIITNGDDNGYYSSTAPLTITSINGVMLGSGFGVGLTYTPTYTGGRCVSIIITNAGNGYGNNLVEAPITFSYPSAPSTLASITGKTIVQGQLIALTLGSGGAGYKNPTIFINPVSISPPVQAVYAPVYKIPSAIQGVRMINHGRGYTSPPTVVIDNTSQNPSSTLGNIPLYAEMTPTNLIQPNYYYTIKADGFSFNRTLYTNQDNKGMPTIAICSTNEIINNEDYIELVLPAQVITDLTLEIKERDGSGLGTEQSLTTLIEITELDEKDVWFDESRRQEY